MPVGDSDSEYENEHDFASLTQLRSSPWYESSGLLSLPNEIWLVIINAIDWVASVKQLANTCKRFFLLTRARFWRFVRLGHRATDKKIVKIFQLPALHHYIRQVEVHCFDRITQTVITVLLPLLPNLRELTFRAEPDDYESDSSDDDEYLYFALVSKTYIDILPSLPKLERLTFDSHVPIVQLRSTTLQYLHFKRIGSDDFSNLKRCSYKHLPSLKIITSDDAVNPHLLISIVPTLQTLQRCPVIEDADDVGHQMFFIAQFNRAVAKAGFTEEDWASFPLEHMGVSGNTPVLSPDASLAMVLLSKLSHVCELEFHEMNLETCKLDDPKCEWPNRRFDSVRSLKVKGPRSGWLIEGSKPRATTVARFLAPFPELEELHLTSTFYRGEGPFAVAPATIDRYLSTWTNTFLPMIASSVPACRVIGIEEHVGDSYVKIKFVEEDDEWITESLRYK